MALSYSESVAGEVRAEIARQRRTQGEVAVSAGWNQQYLSRRLTCDIAFSTDDIEILARVLGVPIGQLITPTVIAAAS
jgi:hypothetical protein